KTHQAEGRAANARATAPAARKAHSTSRITRPSPCYGAASRHRPSNGLTACSRHHTHPREPQRLPGRTGDEHPDVVPPQHHPDTGEPTTRPGHPDDPPVRIQLPLSGATPW
ncbi:hypothetical protein, partial [Streptomyces antibioticus]|uniref:hypothetical protein n=1 Tax=Streptomyces antibioticus TaxID=1890 RepID=UPI003D73A1FB